MDSLQQQLFNGAACYFYTEEKDTCVLPIQKTNYNISIENNFATVVLEQTYWNPFERPLEIHYSIPTDPNFSISNLRVNYQNAVVEGVVIEKEKAKVQYKKSVEKGETVMMANYSKSQTSILKMKIGNIQSGETITVNLELFGPLNTEIPDQWTLRIPSHIGPRYTSFKDFLPKMFDKFLKQITQKRVLEAYMVPHIEWSFSIKLNCSDKIVSWNCDTHKLEQLQISPNSYEYLLNEPVLPEIDLQFSYRRENPNTPLCTIGKNSLCLTVFSPLEESKKENPKKFEFIFLLDRSGSMGGPSIESAKKALTIYLKSLPQNSMFNIISFGSNFERMYKNNQLYTQQIVKQTIQKVQQFKADFGGTQINEPLNDLLKREKQSSQHETHIIVLTDGQVSNTQTVIQTIKKLRENKIGFTHTVGIGSGFSMELIKKGAEAGHGESVVILNSNNMTRKIISLLQSIIKPKITKLQFQFSKEIFDQTHNKLPERLPKGRPFNIYLDINSKAAVSELNASNNLIKIKYFDQEDNKMKQLKVQCNPSRIFQQLDKFYAKMKIQELLDNSASQQNKSKAIALSIEHQVLCKLAAFLCKIKQNPAIQATKASYYLKLRSGLEGKSQLHSKNSYGDISVKTLTGKTITFSTSLFITVEQLKQMVQQSQGIPIDQQRMIYAGKQVENDLTLADYGIEGDATLHLVLRLRGGDGGGGSSRNTFFITIEVCGKKIRMKQPQVTPATLIAQLYKQTILQTPQLSSLDFKLQFNGQSLQKQKHISDYANITRGSQLKVTGVPLYLINVDELIKLIKIDGSWEFDQTIIDNLKLQEIFEEKMKKFENDKLKSMTAAIVHYLKKNYPNKNEDLVLIYKKANEFLNRQKQ